MCWKKSFLVPTVWKSRGFQQSCQFWIIRTRLVWQASQIVHHSNDSNATIVPMVTWCQFQGSKTPCCSVAVSCLTDPRMRCATGYIWWASRQAWPWMVYHTSRIKIFRYHQNTILIKSSKYTFHHFMALNFKFCLDFSPDVFSFPTDDDAPLIHIWFVYPLSLGEFPCWIAICGISWSWYISIHLSLDSLRDTATDTENLCSSQVSFGLT